MPAAHPEARGKCSSFFGGGPSLVPSLSVGLIAPVARPMPGTPASPQTSALVSPMALLEHVPVTAYLLRAEGDDFVLEGVNAAARAKTPALKAVIGKRISILYADQPQMIADAQRCHR